MDFSQKYTSSQIFRGSLRERVRVTRGDACLSIPYRTVPEIANAIGEQKEFIFHVFA